MAMSLANDLSKLPLLADELLEDNGSHCSAHRSTLKNEKDKIVTEGSIPCSVKILKHRRHHRAIVLTAVSSSLATIALMLCFWSVSARMSHTQPFIYDTFFSRARAGTHFCGNTTSEAFALGCRFDELADLWLPPKCSRAFEDEYLKTNHGGPFLYWADTKGQHLLSNRSLYVGGNTYFSTTRDHLVHCEYNLYRFARALKTGEPVGHDGGFSDHMHHCANMLGKFANKAEGIDKIDVTTESGFGYC